MKTHNWSDEKSRWLEENRGISFEDVMFYLVTQNVMTIIEHPNQDKYSHQRMYVLDIDDYIYLVPFVENDKEIFLKTIIPSRSATKKYKEGTYER